ncbi:MAG: polysaccharide deacetylase family protein [Clostridiales Family XIII bacterium]|nr:polysaccharide deacetylase family protein [Clostridiales Family XIII bacterium]
MSSFASDVAAGERKGTAEERPKEAKVTFYAGDAAVTEVSIKPSPQGGYVGLPDASKDGYDFVGWYTGRTGGKRVTSREYAGVKDGDTLYARWRKESEGVDESVSGLPVLMYHWFYDTDGGDERPTSLLNNWMEASQFEDEMICLKEAGWYFPTWDEVYAYVRGKIDLPDRSIVITIDDGKASFYKYAVPILEKHGVRGTGFIIAHKLTEKKVMKYSSELVSLQSHTWDMHDGYGGKSLIQLLPFDEAVADLTSAAAILGTTDALAYPYGYYDDTAVDVCRAAGIRMAFGTSGGKVYPGMDPLRLPRVRVSSSQSTQAFRQIYG